MRAKIFKISKAKEKIILKYKLKICKKELKLSFFYNASKSLLVEFEENLNQIIDIFSRLFQKKSI